MAIIPNFYIGDHVEVPLTFTDSLGSPIPLTGYVIYFTIKQNKDDTDAEAVHQSTLVITDALNGKASLVVQKSVTNLLQPGIYFSGVRVIDGTGKPTTIVDETIEIYKGVTDAIT